MLSVIKSFWRASYAEFRRVLYALKNELPSGCKTLAKIATTAAATYEPVRTYKCVQGVERWPSACGWRAEAAAPHQTAWRGQQ